MTTRIQKIVPHLWFDKEAREAAHFYTTVFPDSRILHESVLHDTPSGDVDSLVFEIWGTKFQAISAGPVFKLNPSVSFMVNFDPSRDNDSRKKIDEVWEKLTQGGNVLMPLDQYPFSERYGWVEDKYGVSWQLIFTNPEGEERPAIVPSLLFAGDVCGKAEEAIELYLSVFKNSRQGSLFRYGANQAPDKEGTIMFADFMLENEWFAIMDSAHEHKFSFNESLSFIINCQDQEEVDYYWSKLTSNGGQESMCGWLKDKFGISWQVVPIALGEMMTKGTKEQIDRVTRTFLKMKKLDIQKLEEAYSGK